MDMSTRQQTEIESQDLSLGKKAGEIERNLIRAWSEAELGEIEGKNAWSLKGKDESNWLPCGIFASRISPNTLPCDLYAAVVIASRISR